MGRALELVTEDPTLTLRDLFNALVREGRLVGTQSRYVGLSREATKMRRAGRFPELARSYMTGPTASWREAKAERLTDQQAQWLGPALVAWGEAHADAVAETRAAMRRAGWPARGHTAALVTVAQRARDELAAEANGVSPSLRAVYYRLVQHYGMGKTVQRYGMLMTACVTARERGVMDRRAFVDHKTPDMSTPQDWSLADALDHVWMDLPDDGSADTGIVVAIVCEARGMAPGLAGALTQRMGFPEPVDGRPQGNLHSVRRRR